MYCKLFKIPILKIVFFFYYNYYINSLYIFVLFYSGLLKFTFYK